MTLLRLFGCALLALVVSASSACRIEIGAPGTSGTPGTSRTPADGRRDDDDHNGGDSDDGGRPRGQVVLYTSAYREVADAWTALAHERLPDVDVVVFQGGSEKVAARLDADLAAGGASADVLLVSDPFLYRRLKRDGLLLPYASPLATPIDRRLVDVDNAFVAARVSTMVIAHHTGKTPRAEVPDTFQALLLDDDAPANAVAFGDPLSSGTAFMTAVTLGRGDVSFLGRLRARGAAIAGGNSVVLQKVLSGERRFGVVLLENVLAARARGEPVGFVIPKDGAVVVAGDVAILKSARNPRAARALVDLILSPAGQEIVRGPVGFMHAVDPRTAPPALPGVHPDPQHPGDDVPALADLLTARPPDAALLDAVAADRKRVLDALERGLLGDAPHDLPKPEPKQP